MRDPLRNKQRLKKYYKSPVLMWDSEWVQKDEDKSTSDKTGKSNSKVLVEKKTTDNTK